MLLVHLEYILDFHKQFFNNYFYSRKKLFGLLCELLWKLTRVQSEN